jgi:hypothetical protein
MSGLSYRRMPNFVHHRDTTLSSGSANSPPTTEPRQATQRPPAPTSASRTGASPTSRPASSTQDQPWSIDLTACRAAPGASSPIGRSKRADSSPIGPVRLCAVRCGWGQITARLPLCNDSANYAPVCTAASESSRSPPTPCPHSPASKDRMPSETSRSFRVPDETSTPPFNDYNRCHQPRRSGTVPLIGKNPRDVRHAHGHHVCGAGRRVMRAVSPC